LIYLGTAAGLMLPAVSRLPPAVEVISILFLMFAGPAYDKLRHGSVHRAYKWGIPFGIAATVIQAIVDSTTAWIRFASWLTQ